MIFRFHLKIKPRFAASEQTDREDARRSLLLPWIFSRLPEHPAAFFESARRLPNQHY
jgi:hypothetical protein